MSAARLLQLPPASKLCGRANGGIALVLDQRELATHT
jgi:hypothetical protein